MYCLLIVIIQVLNCNSYVFSYKERKSEHLKHKVHELKELACDVLECLEEAYSESSYEDSRERSRRDERDSYRMYEDDYDYRESARGRSVRGRY